MFSEFGEENEMEAYAVLNQMCAMCECNLKLLFIYF